VPVVPVPVAPVPVVPVPVAPVPPPHWARSVVKNPSTSLLFDASGFFLRYFSYHLIAWGQSPFWR
jgi:hypothetical protein